MPASDAAGCSPKTFRTLAIGVSEVWRCGAFYHSAVTDLRTDSIAESFAFKLLASECSVAIGRSFTTKEPERRLDLDFRLQRNVLIGTARRLTGARIHYD